MGQLLNVFAFCQTILSPKKDKSLRSWLSRVLIYPGYRVIPYEALDVFSVLSQKVAFCSEMAD